MTAIPGYDYVLSGYTWQNPSHITYSIAHDGVLWDHGTNDLNAVFNARFGTGGDWQREIARALATWESVANINIVPVGDGAYNENSLGYAQNDPRFGDIRVGGYAFLNNTTTLAQTYYPPPNGSTAAGDVEVNTAMNFNIDSDYDLYSVLLHEFGHALGLAHSQNPATVMYADYGGIRSGLTEGDIAGIQALYGARRFDTFQQQGLGFNFQAPIDVSGGLAGSSSESVSGLSLQSIGGSEYFSFVAPAYARGSLQVTAAAANLSLLSPQVSIYDSSGRVLKQASNPSSWGTNVTAVIPNVVPGQRYYVVVTGATHDVFDAGAYRLDVSLPNSQPAVAPSQPPTSVPVPTPPPVTTAVIPPSANNSPSTATRLGRVTWASLANLHLSSGSELDYFTLQLARNGSYVVTAPGVQVEVFNARGMYVAGGVGQVSVPPARARTTLLVRTFSASGAAVPNYSLSVSPAPAIAVRRRLALPRRVAPAARRAAPVRAAHFGLFNGQRPAAPARLSIASAAMGTLQSVLSRTVLGRFGPLSSWAGHTFPARFQHAWKSLLG
jgi:hypothetical protein